MGSNLTHLYWDSNFFNLKIAKIDNSNSDEKDLLYWLEKAKNDGYELVYIYDQPHRTLHPTLLNNYNISLVDIKVTFSKNLTQEGEEINCEVLKSATPEDINSLYHLAFESGTYSRFRVDPHFQLSTFETFYKEWIDNSLKREIADDILVQRIGNIIIGFVTVKYTEDVATIGLIAVSPLHRGKRIGENLLKGCFTNAYKNGCKIINVATQKDNKGACKFYENQCMNISQVQKIYHSWPQKKLYPLINHI